MRQGMHSERGQGVGRWTVRTVLGALSVLSAMSVAEHGFAQPPTAQPPTAQPPTAPPQAKPGDSSPATSAPEPPAAAAPVAADGAVPGEQDAMEARHAWFTKTLNGCELTGHFTIAGKNDTPREETYRIEKVEKLPQGDLWLFHTQIKYGDHDVKLPLPLPVLWAGDTPVITLDQLTIPGLGTFDARVLITEDKYVGTWAHGQVSGHMYGKVVRPAE